MFACLTNLGRQWFALPRVGVTPRFVQALGALLFVLVLSGCSSLQVAYNYAPNYLSYRLNGYLNLNDAQKLALDQEFVQFMQWHSEMALPSYTRALETWRARVDDPAPFTATEVLEIQEQVEQALETLGQRAAQQLAGLMVTLTDKQQKRLREQFESENKEYFDEYLKNPNSDATRKNHHKRALKRFEDWLGRLTTTQEALITGSSDKRSKVFLAWGDERVLRQEALLTVVEQQQAGKPAQAESALSAYLSSLKGYREPSLASQQIQLRLEWAEVTAEILNSLTAEQKVYFKKKLGGYAQDFASLTTKRLAQTTER
ncbi:MAG: DUF6279 family lipoprotein [Alcaligenaceae bacterium]